MLSLAQEGGRALGGRGAVLSLQQRWSPSLSVKVQPRVVAEGEG